MKAATNAVLILLSTLLPTSARRLPARGPRMQPATALRSPTDVAVAPGNRKQQQRLNSGYRRRPVLGAGAFDGPERVAALLRAHGIDTSEWGTGLHNKSVSVDHLFKELELGETRLEFHSGGVGVRRLVEVVKVRVSTPGAPQWTLIEAQQRFSDGSSRTRGRSLSEKCYPHEQPLEAAKRGVLEELGPAMAACDGTAITLDADSLVSWVEYRASSSYPDLPTRYQIWRVDAVVEGIPDQNFTTLEKVATPEDPAAMTAAAAAAQAETARVEFRSSSTSTAPPAAAAAMSAAFSRVWSGATLRRRRASRSPRNGLAVLSSAKLTEAVDAVVGSSSSSSTGVSGSSNGRPLKLPSELMHVWEWVDSRQQRVNEQERLQRENGMQRRLLREQGAQILAKGLGEGGCKVESDGLGGYRVVCDSAVYNSEKQES